GGRAREAGGGRGWGARWGEGGGRPAPPIELPVLIEDVQCSGDLLDHLQPSPHGKYPPVGHLLRPGGARPAAGELADLTVQLCRGGFELHQAGQPDVSRWFHDPFIRSAWQVVCPPCDGRDFLPTFRV